MIDPDHRGIDQVRFVEDKPIDWRSVEHALQESARAGRWANFGPVQQRLADVVAAMLALPADRTVVPASSATSALHALVGSHAQAAGRPLVWAISAFGFYSTAIGPLAGRVRVVDCDRNAQIAVSELSALPPASWDGLLVTDVFGAQQDMTALSALCAKAGKPMIIDAAVSFPARRPPLVRASEIVSFHHTKPWGLGEGGCAIVDTERAGQVRSFLNFGVGADALLMAYASNGKMSDFAAALILQRLEFMARWSDGYRRQRQRIAALARSAGLEILVEPAPDVVAPHLALLARRPVDLPELARWPFAVAKYYRPLAGNCPVAADLYARVVNVPCHPGMAAIADDALNNVFATLAGGCTGP